MPIKPENRKRYPSNWKEIRASILERAHDRCEFCGRKNHSHFWNEKTGKMVKVVLTVAHLDHTPENCDPENLRALCQACHNRYDAKHRARTRYLANKKCETCKYKWYIPGNVIVFACTKHKRAVCECTPACEDYDCAYKDDGKYKLLNRI